MKKQILLFLLLLSVAASAQKKAKIEFAEKVHDFGAFSIDLKTVSCKFPFTNTGDAPLVIVRATASCGCTQPTYPEEPIAPGKSGEIEVVYKADAAGSFQKSVTVYSSADPSRMTLIIKGTVMESAESRSATFPYQIGDLLLKSTHLSFYEVSPNQVKTERIPIANSSDKPLTLYFSEIPTGLLVTALPATLPPQGSGEIVVTYNAARMDDWGLRDDQFYITTQKNEKINPENKITVSADIREDFSRLAPAQLKNAPVVEASGKMFDFDQVTGKKEVWKEITITNVGKSALVIRKVSPAANFLAAEISSKQIEPGKSAVLKVGLNPAKLPQGIANSRVTLITNDPTNPVINYRTVGTIK